MVNQYLQYCLHTAYFAVIVWRLNYYVNPLVNFSIILMVGFLLKIANQGSSIIKNEATNMVKNYHRLYLESIGLFIDGYYGYNYCFQLILFERFIDIFMFIVPYWPLIKQFISFGGIRILNDSFWCRFSSGIFQNRQRAEQPQHLVSRRPAFTE